MKDLKLTTRLLIGGLLVVAVPILVIGIVSVYKSSESMSTLARGNMTVTATMLAEIVEFKMNEQLTTAKNISFSNSVIAASEKVFREGEGKSSREIALVQKELNKIKNAAGGGIDGIMLMKRDFISFASSDSGRMKGLNVAGREYLDKALKGTANVGEAVFSRRDNRAVCTAAAPIFSADGKQITGAVLVGVEIKLLTNLVDEVKFGTAGYASILDKNGYYITHPVKENILKANIFQTKGMEPLAAQVQSGRPGIREYTLEGSKKIAAFTPVPTIGWSVIVTVPSDELFAPARFTRNVIIAVGMIFLILGSAFFYFVSRSLTYPLGKVVEAADRIASGDLSVNLATKRKDEIGRVAAAFTEMVRSLKEKAYIAEQIASNNLTVEVAPLSTEDVLGNAFATMVEKLRKQIHEIVEGVNVLASSGSEIMASITELTAGAAETSTAISETTTTVEEVKRTAELTNEKAKQVTELGQKAVDTSRKGVKSVEDTVNGMNRIREQMESIADMVVRLSEQSQAIGEIIASVNDLAEQSNLLAVNASIEAAKAGEQGRGFAVVAQEIRSLANQSKQATTQVRGILMDIQKAITSAVMATEQGGKAVEAGVTLSAQAGQTIDALTERLKEATNAAIQIAASSQQQLIGMDQVVLAMENIREASSQTVTSTRQTERAVHDLHNLGQRLQGIVKAYRVSNKDSRE